MRAPTEPSEKHVAAAKRRLVHLQGLSDQSEAAEQNILSAAVQRRVAVQGDLDRLQPRVNLDPSAADSYTALIQERGELDTIIARSRQVLGQ